MKTLQLFLLICIAVAMLAYSYFSFANNADLERVKQSNRKHFKTKIYPRYYDDDLHVEWPFEITKHYNDSNLYLWNEVKKSNYLNPNGIGEAGAGFVPPDDMKVLMEKLQIEHNYNLLASDSISLHRSLPDPRWDECKTLSYPRKLPKASVIIIFHNEAWTTLLRTVWSVIDRSPNELIKEIILVDDLSTRSFLKRPLDDYIELLPVSIKLIRNAKREGLIRARLIGAQQATGSVLIFLDAHVECCDGWLQPLLARIANDRAVIAVPLIDAISSDDMSYEYNPDTFINGFSWSLAFNWMTIPERETVLIQNDKTAPVRTPTLVGCAFAVDHDFFFEIGSYDSGMNIWGLENMEMSLRVWQCGGCMEVIPCSRIGHLYRRSTYSFNGNANEITSQNSVRLAEVGMSDLKYLYYAASPGHKRILAGDLTERFQVKERLKCKSFHWFLENVYPESNMRMEFAEFGEESCNDRPRVDQFCCIELNIRGVSTNKCADINYGDDAVLFMYDCHGQGGNQMFAFAKNQMIATQNPEQCIGVNKKLDAVSIVKCMTENSQLLWMYDKEKKWLIHVASGYCMLANQTEVILGNCDSGDKNFCWEINSTL